LTECNVENHQKSPSRNPNWQFQTETFRKGRINANCWVRMYTVWKQRETKDIIWLGGSQTVLFTKYIEGDKNNIACILYDKLTSRKI